MCLPRRILTNGRSAMLTAMFSPAPPLRRTAEGHVYIDRSGERFSTVLSFLITGTCPELPASGEELKMLLDEAAYYKAPLMALFAIVMLSFTHRAALHSARRIVSVLLEGLDRSCDAYGRCRRVRSNHVARLRADHGSVLAPRKTRPMVLLLCCNRLLASRTPSSIPLRLPTARPKQPWRTSTDRKFAMQPSCSSRPRTTPRLYRR